MVSRGKGPPRREAGKKGDINIGLRKMKRRGEGPGVHGDKGKEEGCRGDAGKMKG